MAHVRKRSGSTPKPYDVRWRTPDGVEHSKSFATLSDARAERIRIERDEMAGLSLDPRRGEETLGAYADAWLSSRIVKGQPLRASTRQGYEGLLRRNFASIRTKRLRQLTPEVVRVWYSEVTAAAGPDQAAKSYRVLRAVLNTAFSDERIARNPCRIRGGGAENAAERPLLATSTVLALMEAIDDRYRALVALGGLGGLRTGEMLGLQRRDVDQLHELVRVERQAQEISGRRVVVPPKTDAGRRTVALPAPVVRILARHLELYAQPGPDGFVFTDLGGGPVRRATLSEAWRVACSKVGAPAGLRIHDLRHHAATLTARVPGITTKELMARIGHSTPRAALLYQHATQERDQRVASFLEEQLATATKERDALVPVRDIRGTEQSA